MTTNIYILKLQGGNFYVGKSDNPMKRYQEHLDGSGSAWTKKYKPIGVEKIIPNASPFDEDRYVKEYMHKHGMDKVRGGAYVLEELPDFQIEALKSELWGSTDKCTTCGYSGHWAKDCYAKKDVTGAEIVNESESEEEIINCAFCKKEFPCEFEFKKHICRLNTYICGDCDKEFSSEWQLNKHKCFKPSKTKKSTGSCYRCGRSGHYSPDCYARTHKDGYDLDFDDD